VTLSCRHSDDALPSQERDLLGQQHVLLVAVAQAALAAPVPRPGRTALLRSPPVVAEASADLSAPELAALQAKEVLQSYNQTIEGFPQPLPAPAPLRALLPAASGLGAGLVVLRQIGVATREEREARERAEAAARMVASRKNAATIGVVPVAVAAATIFLGTIIAPPEGGAPTSATLVQQSSKRVFEAEARSRQAAAAKAAAEASAAKAAAAAVEEEKAAAQKALAAATAKAETLEKAVEAEKAAKEDVAASVAMPDILPPPPQQQQQQQSPPPPPVPASALASAPASDMPAPALAAGAAVAVGAAVAAAGGGEGEESAASGEKPAEAGKEVVWPVEGKVTSWYDAGKRL